ncbi:conserved hypothetical protein, partial [delta proteobacterium NaphS2]
MDQVGVIPGHQSADFLHTKAFQMFEKLINQLLTDAFLLVIGINSD